MGDHQHNLKIFFKLMKSYPSQYNFREWAVLFSLYQMALRPDISGPTSSFFFYIKEDKEEYFNSFHSSTPESNKVYPFIVGLDHLLKKKDRSVANLYKLLRGLLQVSKKRPVIEEKLSSFLKENYSMIEGDKLLNRFFVKGKSLKQTGERMELAPNLSFLKKPNAGPVNRIETIYGLESRSNQDMELRCNKDLSQFLRSEYSPVANLPDERVYAIKWGKNIFVASNFTPRGLSPLGEGPYFKASSPPNPSSFCLARFKTPKQEREMAVISVADRESAQHLLHLFNDKNSKLENFEGLKKAIEGPRRIILSNPPRVVVEGHRTSKAQLRKILNLQQIPIYHATALGKIWGLYNDSTQSRGIIDQRHRSTIVCQ